MVLAKRRVLPAAAVILAASLVLSTAPSAIAISSTGIWVFPHAHQSDITGGGTDSAYYIGANTSAVLADSFYADSGADSANIQVDIYNPSGAKLLSVQLFAAIIDTDNFTSISFAGGES